MFLGRFYYWINELGGVEDMNMFFPVRIFDKHGKFKKEISIKTLERRHWRQFEEVKTVPTADDKEAEQNCYIEGFEQQHGYH